MIMEMFDTDLNDKINEMRNALVVLLDSQPPTVGATAMTSLIVEAVSYKNNNTKEQFLSDMSKAWDHYTNPENEL